MAQVRTSRDGMRRRTDRPIFARIAPPAAFISQLIAEHERWPVQRARRRATPDDVALAYAAGSALAQRRLPPGYRMARDA